MNFNIYSRYTFNFCTVVQLARCPTFYTRNRNKHDGTSLKFSLNGGLNFRERVNQWLKHRDFTRVLIYVIIHDVSAISKTRYQALARKQRLSRQDVNSPFPLSRSDARTTNVAARAHRRARRPTRRDATPMVERDTPATNASPRKKTLRHADMRGRGGK